MDILANKNKKSSDIKALGEHPKSGKTLVIKDGRYGPYISDGKINVSLKNTNDIENLTLEKAVDLINQKQQSTPKNRSTKKRKK